jgi:hypothetical protein
MALPSFTRAFELALLEQLDELACHAGDIHTRGEEQKHALEADDDAEHGQAE